MPPKKKPTYNEFNVQRQNIIAKLTRFEEYLEQFEANINTIQLKLRLNKLEELWREFEDVQTNIEQIPETNQHNEQEARKSFEDKYFTLSARAEELINQHTTDTHSGHLSVNPEIVPITVQPNHNHIKLPVIDLPKFNGQYDQWTQYHDTFKSLIHDSAHITTIEKFHYLKSSLHGEAAQLIESLTITIENYEVAWNLIKTRYENRRLIVYNHVNALLELPSIGKESASALRQLTNSFLKHVRALEAHKQPVHSWDGIIIPLLCSKFDIVTKQEWESAQNSPEIPKLEELISFLNKRCQILEVSKPKSEFKHQSNITKFNKVTSHVTTNNNANPCAFCKGQHHIFNCNNFLKLSNQNRFNEIKNLKLCTNCLRGNHFSKDCKSTTCRTCGKRHNTLLHFDNSSTEDEIKVGSVEPAHGIISTCCSNLLESQVILSTAIIQVFDAMGKPHQCRALLDSGSQSHFISASLCKKLNLSCHTITTQFPVSGIGQSTRNIENCTQIKIKSRFNGFQTTIKCLVLPTITEDIPNTKFESSILKIPQNIQLADSTYNTPGSIDLLIGADLFYHMLCVGQISLGKGKPILQKTKLGWIISGSLPLAQTINQQSSCYVNVTRNLENQLSKFWIVEEVENKGHFSKTETDCEQHFVDNIIRETNGRYMVKLPIKENPEILGHSHDMALKRFYSLERRLQNNKTLQVAYLNFMREYEGLNHMSLVTIEESSTDATYYLPHHAVIKPDSKTTKVRVVFDGSAKTSTNVSLNDNLLVGPTIQDDLFSILIRFRTHQFVLTADIEKMYRQVNVYPEDRNLQRILWREAPSQPLKTYTLNTVTYGTASAPFQAVRVLKQLALDEGHRYPRASSVLLRDFYVDDCITGSSTIEEAKQLKQELSELLRKGQFNLCKWKSNDKAIIPLETEETNNLQFSLDNEQPIKTLGLYWNPTFDTLQYTIINKTTTKISKREILSLISQIFDPLGLLGPIIIISKIIMQQLWQLKLDWDETLPLSLHTKWQTYYNDLSVLNNLKIPRKIIETSNINSIEIHGFCDASEAAYGACLYLKTIDNHNNSHVTLICSKTRVAPLKSLSVPRLELCAALLLSKLSNKIRSAMPITFNHIYHWTDSSIVIAWIQKSPHSLKQFVANRIAEIQTLSETINWKHVPSADNPADLLTRGAAPNELAQRDIWWHGPIWLKEEPPHWPTFNPSTKFTNEEFEARRTIILVTTNVDFTILSRYSSFIKLKRIIAWCHRFKFNTCNQDNKVIGPLTTQELLQAETTIMKLVQAQHFSSEIRSLKASNTVDKSSKLSNLSPFLDEKGVIRVGGRLKNAFIPYNQKHPIIIPGKCDITTSIINEEHINRFHCGPQSLLAFVRLKFWPLSAKNVIRKITRNCIKCFRCNPRPAAHTMGNLPADRLKHGNRPFSISGIDYCGPFSIIESRGRGRKRISKCYVAIFICFSTKAVHIEPVTELTGEAFLAALKRFTARRGLCQDLYSDNGTNFVKANNDLTDIYQFLKQHGNTIASELAQQNIIWHFNPPRAPHFGGLWEAAVKLLKYHLKRVLNINLTYEEFYTITTQIEAILNSRPLIPLSSNPDDLTTLTPAHYLIGDSLIAPLESDHSHTKVHLLSRWKHLQLIRQHFWQRWSKDYLHHLQTKGKWTHEKNHLMVGALVLLMDDNLPPQQWKCGRITQLHPGNDSIVRVVSIKTNSGITKRAVRKICVLPNENLYDNE